MPDFLRRALRTFLQTWTGLFLGLWAASGLAGDDAALDASDLSTVYRLGISAALASIPALVSFVQNALEDHTRVPAILKAPPSSGENPVPDG